MLLLRWMGTELADKRMPDSAAPAQLIRRGRINGAETAGRAALFILLFLLIAPVGANAATSGQATPGPTAESALAADEALARAIRENNPDEILRWLDDNWAVISTTGGMGEGPSVFPDGIKSGVLTRKTFELSEPRVRLYGNTAVVTTKVKTSGTLQGKPFDVTERQTDVLFWKNGKWKCVLTHETKIQNN